MDGPATQARQQHHQVVQLCIGYVHDVTTLLRVSLASRAQQSCIVGHVKQQLPILLKQALTVGVKPRSSLPLGFHIHYEAVTWLLGTAGPAAVGMPAVTEALLHLGYSNIALHRLCLQFGLQVTSKQLVDASKQRVKGLDTWLDATHHHAAASSSCSSSSCSSSIPAHMTQLGAVRHSYTLPEQLTTEELQDLLIVAVNLPHEEPAGQLFDYDQQHKQLLYNRSGNSSTGQLLEHLISTAVIRGHWVQAVMLAETPAVQQLNAQAVTKLLYLLLSFARVPAQRPGAPADSQDSDGDEQLLGDHLAHAADMAIPCCGILCALPAANTISADTAASLLRLSVKQRQYELAHRLCLLPAAEQLPSQQLCELLQQLVLPDEEQPLEQQFEQRQLLVQLSHLQAFKHLTPDALVELLTMVLNEDAHEFVNALNLLSTSGAISQLTATEVLQLLQHAAEVGNTVAVREVAGLAAAREIDDTEGFVAFLLAALKHGVSTYAVAGAVQGWPVLRDMAPDTVLDLLRGCIQSRRSSKNSEHCMYGFVLEHPAVSSFSTAVIEQLLLEAAQHQRLAAVAGLLTVRAAVWLSVEVTAELLQHAVQELLPVAAVQADLRCISYEAAPRFALEAMHPSLLHLPAAQQLSADDVVRVLTAAVEATPPNTKGLELLCGLPGTQQVSTEAALALLQRAAQRGYQVWLAVLEHLPQLASLPAEQLQLTSNLYRNMEEAVTADDSVGLQALCRLDAGTVTATAALHHISPEQVQSLLTLALGKSRSCVEQLLELQAAQALAPDAVANLMQACVDEHNTAGLKLVAQLPGASKLDEWRAAALVHRFVDANLEDHIDTGAFGCPESFLTVLLQQPAVQRLPADAVARLLAQCIDFERWQQLQLLRTQLPPAKQGALPQDAVRQLLQSAFEARQWGVFDWLVGLPAAPVDDAEVCILREVRACKSAQ